MNGLKFRLMKGIGLALMASTLLVLLFILLNPFHLFQADQDKPVVKTMAPVYLEESQLVSFLKDIPLIYDYRRVKIKENEIYIDLVWPHHPSDDAPFKQAYVDAIHIISAIFTGTSNMDQIYLRFIHYEDQSPVLLLAVSCQRQESLVKDLIQSNLVFEQPKLFLEQYARLVYGTGWRK